MHEFQRKALAEKAARLERKRLRSSPTKRSPVSEAQQLYWAIKKRAAEKGWDFDLTLEWVEQMVTITHCQATGIEFHGEPGGPFRRSIDRKDSRRGYVMDNCWVVSWIYNRAKSNNSHEDVIRMATALVGN